MGHGIAGIDHVLIAVDDLDRTAESLAANRIVFRRRIDRLVVWPEDAMGLGLEFVQP